MKKILIINGHPDKESLCSELAESYKRGADASGALCKLVNLADLEFNPVLKYGYRQRTELEPDLVSVQNDISESDHIVMVYPNWWSTYPALLKGFIDRTFLPQFAFKYRDNSSLWDKLLKGKSARLIVTMDTPKWYYWLINRNAGHYAMKVGVLEFSGIKPVRITAFGPVRTASDKKRAEWIRKSENLGQKQQ
jgi:putative NADPH-quinone reductase